MAAAVAGLGVVLDGVIPRGVSLVLQVIVGGIVYVALIAATDRSAFDDALVLVRQRRLRARAEPDAGPAVGVAPAGPVAASPGYIPFDDIGRQRARWEDIAEAWSPSSASQGYPTLTRRRGEIN